MSGVDVGVAARRVARLAAAIDVERHHQLVRYSPPNKRFYEIKTKIEVKMSIRVGGDLSLDFFDGAATRATNCASRRYQTKEFLLFLFFTQVILTSIGLLFHFIRNSSVTHENKKKR